MTTHIFNFLRKKAKRTHLFSRIGSKVLIPFQQGFTEGSFIRCWLDPGEGHFTLNPSSTKKKKKQGYKLEKALI
jgi:hypothetical protein